MKKNKAWLQFQRTITTFLVRSIYFFNIFKGLNMTSPTDKTNRCRDAKKAKMGKKAKNKLRRTGTTPVLFALNKPTSNELKN
jgi:hypothetical protein